MIKNTIFGAVGIGVILFASACGTGPESTEPAANVVVSEAPPSADTKVERREENGRPILAAIDARGETRATYARTASTEGEDIIIRIVERSAALSTLTVHHEAKGSEATVTTSGRIGERTWRMSQENEGEGAPDAAARSLEPWAELFANAMDDQENANHIAKGMLGAEGTLADDQQRGLVCSSVCGVITSAACTWKTAYGLVLCSVGSTFLCASVCANVPSGQMACFSYRNGQCVRQTCCQPVWGCRTTNVRGCPY